MRSAWTRRASPSSRTSVSTCALLATDERGLGDEDVYAASTKGTQACGAAMLLAATRGGSADALFAELQGSQPQMLAWLKRNLALMPPKAYRWVAEMHGSPTSSVRIRRDELYAGAAHFYEQIAQDFEGDKRRSPR